MEALRADSPARAYLQEQLEHLEQQLARVQDDLQALRQQDDPLDSQCRLLMSIVGIGQTSALQLLAELPPVQGFTADSWVAHSGLCPHQHHSGTQQSASWLSRVGNPRLRKALYFPTLCAMQHNPHLHRFAQRLKAAGKPNMTVVTAVMRKLLVLIHAILKSGRPYDPTFGLVP